MQFFILLQASGLWLSTKAIKFKAVQGSDGCIWLRGRRRRVPATFTTEMCQQHYPVFTSRLFTHRDGRCSLALQDERFVTFFSAQHISKAAVERSHQSSWWKYEVPRRIWHISGGEADCWCWRVASAHRKKKKTHLALSLNAAHNIQFWSANRQWFFIMWESKKRRSTFYPLAPAVFNQCKRGSGVKHRFPHFLLAKKVKLNVQPYASLNDPANFSVCWSLACFQVLLMYSSSAQRASW